MTISQLLLPPKVTLFCHIFHLFMTQYQLLQSQKVTLSCSIICLVLTQYQLHLLGLRELTCCCLKGLTISIIAAAGQGVMGRVGTAVGLAPLAKLLTWPFLGTQPVGPPYALRLVYSWLWIGMYHSLTFCLELLVVLLNHDLPDGLKIW